MSALDRTPQNTNLLQPTKFVLTFARLPNIQFFCQSVNVPGVSLGKAGFNTPFLDNYIAGNKLTYNPLEITFLLDEAFSTWQELYTWLLAIASPKGFEERNKLTSLEKKMNTSGILPVKYEDSYSTAILTVNSNLNNPIIRLMYNQVFPTSLSDVKFDTTSSAETTMTCDATFNYDFHEFLTP